MKSAKTRARAALKVSKTKTKIKPNANASPDRPKGSAEATGGAILDELWTTVLSRRTADPRISHSARLLSRGTNKVAQKFGEEAVECLIEAVARNPESVVAESADVLYHLIVLWVASGIEPAEVWDELRRRKGMSGIAEKAARNGPNGTAKIP